MPDWQAEALYFQSVYSSFRLSIRFEHDILKMNELIVMQIGTSVLRGKDVKRSTFGVRRLKVKVTRGQI